MSFERIATVGADAYLLGEMHHILSWLMDWMEAIDVGPENFDRLKAAISQTRDVMS